MKEILPPAIAVRPGLRLRLEHFGALAWVPFGEVYKIGFEHARLLELARQPRLAPALLASGGAAARQALEELAGLGLAVRAVPNEAVPLPAGLLERVDAALALAASRCVTRPFWAHLQPFTFCNQRCIHCYCDAGPDVPRALKRSMAQWKAAIDKIVQFGVWDIYVTGGENLLLDEGYELVEYIKASGALPGISTNAMRITARDIERLRALQLEVVQVSLDGATAQTHDAIRGTPGAFRRTLRGIEALRSITEPVINCVVSGLNRGELPALVELGKSLGVRRFKFFPQKRAGRGAACEAPSDAQALAIARECAALARRFGVDIESFEVDQPCGSGSAGFAVNEDLDLVPCIFGSHAGNFVFGNLAADDLETAWFDSQALRSFRAISAAQPCHRCEAPPVRAAARTLRMHAVT